MTIRLTLLLIFLITFPALAQKEANYWYFGDHTGVSFNTGTASSLGGGKLYSIEGCLSISNPTTGALLFYSNGINIWNRNHELMNNGTGLKGGISSTQNVFVVPNPANSLQYYLFTVPDLTSEGNKTTGLYYSLISVEDPDGVVLSKNNFLTYGISEKITGTLACNGKDYWVVAHDKSRGTFYSYNVTSAGVNTVPVTSTYTGIINDFTSGCMKISPDRTKLALASYINEGYIALFDFDAKTGKVSNHKFLGDGETMYSCYGVSFSPDNTKLYVTAANNSTSTKFSVFQFQVDLPNVIAIRNSVFRIAGEGGIMKGIQLAPDGKIYVTHAGSNFLNVIDKPNLRGDQCGFRVNGLALSGECDWGLPNFQDYIFNSIGTIGGPLENCLPPNAVTKSDTGCLSKIFVFNDLSTSKPTQREWTFENGIPPISTDSSATVQFSQSGIHKVRLIVKNDNGNDTAYAEAVVLPTPIADAGTDKIVCPGESTQIGTIAKADETYIWSPTDGLDDATKATPTVKPTNGTSQYYLRVSNSNGCISFDTVLVSVGTIKANVSNDTTVCKGSSVRLIASGGSEYLWTPDIGLDNPSIPNPIALPNATTTYTVRVSSGSCIDSATVTVTVNSYPTANAGEDITICSGATAQLGDKSEAGNSYLWAPATGLDNPTKSNPTASPVQTTTYYLTVTNGTNCISYDTVVVTVGNLKAVVSADTTICFGSGSHLKASGGTNYSWVPVTGLDNANTSKPIASPSSTTRYKVLVSSGTCLDSAFVTVTVAPPFTADAGENKQTCIGEKVQIGTAPIAGNSYSWTPITGLSAPNSSQTEAAPQTTTQYTLQVTNALGCIEVDSVIITVNPSDERSFTLSPSVVSIIPGVQFQTSLNVPSGVPSWKVHLDYDNLVVKYAGIAQATNGINATATESNGPLTIRGTGDNGKVTLSFNAFLPYNADTTFAMKLIVDSADIQPCDTIITQGNTLSLGEFCGKRLRSVSNTGKKYYITTKENGVNFGVGLSGNVRLELYDYTGTLKEVLADGIIEPGEYSLDFDLPTGVYFCRICAGMYNEVQKVVIVQ